MESLDEVEEFISNIQGLWATLRAVYADEVSEEVTKISPRPSAPPAAAASNAEQASPGQMKFINDLYKELGQDTQLLEPISKVAAASLIDELKARKGQGSPRIAPAARQSAPRQYNNDRAGSITNGQKAYIIRTLTGQGQAEPADLDTWTYNQASNWLTQNT